jgi:hypothetical protein
MNQKAGLGRTLHSPDIGEIRSIHWCVAYSLEAQLDQVQVEIKRQS